MKKAIGHSVLGILVLFALSGCFLLVPPPPPRWVSANLALDKDGVLKIDYMSCINASSYFSGVHYVLDGLSVNESCIPGMNTERCANATETPIWDLDSRQRDTLSVDSVPLPPSLRYGEDIPHTNVYTAAKPLRANADYRLSVQITGFKDRDHYRTFRAVAYFRIESDGKGGVKLIQRGGQSCEEGGGL